jgi:hypothetical protein
MGSPEWARTETRRGLRLFSGIRLTRPRLPAVMALLAVALALPALGTGWLLDDYYHRTVLLGNSRFREFFGPPWEMFRFFRGDPARTTRVMDLGFFPWWTDPSLKAEFFQPLTVATHLLDYALWPDSPMLMHLHSLLWFAALVAVATTFYQRIFGAAGHRPACVAALLFTIDDAHGTPAGWLANRNALIAAVFGIAALIAHDAWRRSSRRASSHLLLLLALVLLAASLCSKEEGLATGAYLAAYGLFLDPAGRLRGCLALIPHAGLVLAWRILRAYGGYGVWDMGLYVDPLSDSGRFAAAVIDRAPILLLGQWGLPPADIGFLLQPPGRAALWWAALLFLGLIACCLFSLIKTDRLARFWTTGMVLAVIPVCGTFPMDRLLVFAGLGAFGLIAQFLDRAFDSTEGTPWRELGRIPVAVMAGFLVVVHLIIAPITLPLRSAFPMGPNALGQRLFVHTALDQSVETQSVVIVNAPSPLHAGYLPLLRELEGAPVPRHTRILAPGQPAVTIRRPDAQSLAIRPERGYLDWVLDRLFRSEVRPMSLGHRVELTGLSVEVTDLTTDGRPAEAVFRFNVPLEDLSLCWLCFRDGRFVPFVPPAVGETVVLRIGGILQLGRPMAHTSQPYHAEPRPSGSGQLSPQRIGAGTLQW